MVSLSCLFYGLHWTPLQTILELCIPEKELAKTRSQISFIYFQSHLWYSVRNYKIPKGIMKTRFEPWLPRMSSWKKLHTMDSNSGPLHKKYIFCHWTTRARYQRYSLINISSIQNYLGLSFLSVTYWFDRFVPSTGIFTWPALWGLYVSGFNGPNTWYWCRGPRFKSRE